MSNDEDEVKPHTCLFVFYKAVTGFNLGDCNISWNWIGSGMTHNDNYPREMQYMGNSEEFHEMYHYLYNEFDKLKNKGIVERFHIAEKYLEIKNL